MTTPTPKFTGVLLQLSTLRYASTEKHNSVVLYCSHGLLTGWPITMTITSVTTRSDKTPLLILIAVGSYYADFYYKRYRFFKRNGAQTVLYCIPPPHSNVWALYCKRGMKSQAQFHTYGVILTTAGVLIPAKVSMAPRWLMIPSQHLFTISKHLIIVFESPDSESKLIP